MRGTRRLRRSLMGISGAVLTFGFALTPALAQNQPDPDEQAQSILARIFEFWRWQNYWWRETDLGAQYRPGKTFTPLVFWTVNGRECGFCSRDLSLCRAYTFPGGVSIEKMEPLTQPSQGAAFEAFMTFLDRGPLASAAPRAARAKQAPSARPNAQISAGDLTSLLAGGMRPPVRVTAEISARLPELALPQAIQTRTVPADLDVLLSRLRRFKCGRHESGQSTSVRTRFVIPFHGELDPVLYVLRQCLDGASGESVLELERGDFGRWMLRSGGVFNDTSTVNETKPLIENAAMRELIEP